ncbi:hypothetical protein DM01DRAFT_1332621 [Hesseltinella vesiculosa]|uniref:Uncharacterized protein n=1 Tax=Hesseltinella vesiculosa TaxID=101127 RepID=A0A1X2GSN1_9FUNG|nr:hypothetical protein DM01DRAFT_1332621 [Hesseltinella vesiculosa]
MAVTSLCGTGHVPYPKTASQVLLSTLLERDNPIQLAAISNYKLAQLTFSPPTIDTLRKTALIKNMADAIYTDTPPEWLDQMRRWSFFTPESLGQMTQDDLEDIFAQYIQTMEAFQPIHLDEDEEDDDLWQEDEILTPNDQSTPIVMQHSLLYSQTNASASVDWLANVDKPLPPSPSPIEDHQRKKKKRASRITIRSKRLSWTSDVGLPAQGSQAWASELMTMFNMDFQVDTTLDLNTAPTLPELPFKRRLPTNSRKRASQRYSSDSFMNLIPAFEAFTLEEGLADPSTHHISFPPPPPTAPPAFLLQPPKPHKKKPLLGSLGKKKSIRRLAALVSGDQKLHTQPPNKPLPQTPHDPGHPGALIRRSSSSTTCSSNTSQQSKPYPSWSLSPPQEDQDPLHINQERMSLSLNDIATSLAPPSPPKRSKSALTRITYTLQHRRPSSHSNASIASTDSSLLSDPIPTPSSSFVQRCASLGRIMTKKPSEH